MGKILLCFSDFISLRFAKKILGPYVVHPLKRILNLSFLTSQVPKRWRHADLPVKRRISVPNSDDLYCWMNSLYVEQKHEYEKNQTAQEFLNNQYKHIKVDHHALADK